MFNLTPNPRFIFSVAFAFCAPFLRADQSGDSSQSSQNSGATRMPQVLVTDKLEEEEPTGAYGAPEWTGERRFPGTRIYLQQGPWEAGAESWWRLKNHRDGTISHRLLEEVEIGLPYRFQLDLYNDIEGDQRGRFHYQSFNIELRWALADWGKIFANPTLYGEYKIADHHWGPDVYELKLLLGDAIAPRVHWGLNFVWEAEIGGEREQEFQIAGGLSYSLIDKRLGIGLEFLYDHDTVRHERNNPANQFNIGPSVQWRVTDRLHVDLSCMFGTNRDSERQIGFLIIGYDFGPLTRAESHYTPVSGRQN